MPHIQHWSNRLYYTHRPGSGWPKHYQNRGIVRVTVLDRIMSTVQIRAQGLSTQAIGKGGLFEVVLREFRTRLTFRYYKSPVVSAGGHLADGFVKRQSKLFIVESRFYLSATGDTNSARLEIL